jgi:hypothetical protein
MLAAALMFVAIDCMWGASFIGGQRRTFAEGRLM